MIKEGCRSFSGGTGGFPGRNMMITALLIFFWAVLPGLITGWMLRERGRTFLPGFLLGVVCGPLGILAALTVIYFSDRRRARGRGHGRGQAVRVFYDIPLVGRLHVSTVWMLAGVATFLCLWMIGGITYEVYRAELNPSATPEQARQTANDSTQPRTLLPTPTPSEKETQETRLAEQSQANTSAQSRSALLGNFSGQPGQHAAGTMPPETPRELQPARRRRPTPPHSHARSARRRRHAATEPRRPRRSLRGASRADAVAEDYTRPRVARYRVPRPHGDSRSATLSLTGATLTREAGNQLLGNGRLRGALRAAGFRIVVVMNGERSWTYML